MAKKKKEKVPVSEELSITRHPTTIVEDKAVIEEESIVSSNEGRKDFEEIPAPTNVKALSEETLSSLYKKHNLPRNFNEKHPRWNVPSMKNRYALLLADIRIHEKL